MRPDEPHILEIIEEIEREYGVVYATDGGWRYGAGQPRAGQFLPAAEQERLNDRLDNMLRVELATRPLAEMLEGPEEWGGFPSPAGGPGDDEDGGGGRGGGIGRSPFNRSSLPYQTAGAFGGVLAAGAGPGMAAVGLAMSPFGGAGAGVTEVAQGLSNLLVSSLRSLAMVGAGVVQLALGALFATAIAGCAAVVLNAVSDIFGRIAETITESLRGVVQIVRDVFNTAVEYAQNAMQMVYFGGQTPEAASGWIAQLQAFGVAPQTTAGIFGQWQMRPEFLGPRLGALGVPEGLEPRETLEAMRGRMQGMPELMRYPMLAGAMGPQAAQALMPIMQMEEGPFREALARGEELAPLTEELRAIREELAPLRAQFELLTTTVKVDLLAGVLEPVKGLMTAVLDLWTGHRREIEGWLQTTAQRGIEGFLLYAEIGIRHIPEAVAWLRNLWETLSRLWARLEPWLERSGRAAGFAEEHPYATAAGVLGAVGLGQVGIGALRGVGAGLLGGGAGAAAGAGAEATAAGLGVATGSLMATLLPALLWLIPPLIGAGIAYYGSGYAGVRRGAGAEAELIAETEEYQRRLQQLSPEQRRQLYGMTEQERAAFVEAGGETPFARLIREIREIFTHIREEVHESARESRRKDEREEADERERPEATIYLRPSREFEVELEAIETLRVWRGIQLMVG